MPFLDELASGIGPASTPDIAAFLGVSGGTTAGAMIVAFHSLALFIETPLLVWSERVSARWFSAGALAAVACSAFLAALLPHGWGLLLAFALYGPAAGCALAVAEGLLVESDPATRERAMARAALAGNAGDLAVPVLLAILAWLGLGWRAGFVCAGAVALLLAAVHLASPSLDRAAVVVDDDGPEPTIREAIRTGLSTPGLLHWSIACTSTNLLDEVLVAFSALHLAAIGASAALRAWAIAGWVIGGFIGLGVIERLVTGARVRRALVAASLVTIAAVATLALTRSPVVGACALFVIGASASTLHPLTKARSYAALPGRPGLVNAIASALLPLDIAAPIGLGLVATHTGTSAAVLALLVSPVLVAIAAVRLLGDSARVPARDATR